MRGWKDISHANRKEKTAGLVILTDKIELKIKKITTDKEGHYIMTKDTTSIEEEDISRHPTQEHLNT